MSSERICKHIEGSCNIMGRCCNKVYCCVFGHNEEQDHTIKKNDSIRVLCGNCNMLQPAGENCTNCKEEFVKYHCKECIILSTKTLLFHCRKCERCKHGNEKYIKHCNECNVCIFEQNEIPKHKCFKERDQENCPICMESFKDMVEACVAISCGHFIHMSCFKKYTKIKLESICPVCRKEYNEHEKGLPKHINYSIINENNDDISNNEQINNVIEGSYGLNEIYQSFHNSHTIDLESEESEDEDIIPDRPLEDYEIRELELLAQHEEYLRNFM